MEERENEYDPKSGAEPTNFIEAFLLERHKMVEQGEDVSNFTNEEFLVNVIDLWLAGMETTTTTMKWAILYMAVRPDVQRRCREEIHSVLGLDTRVSNQDRARLPYTMATINELQRIGNIVPLNVFHRATADVTIGGHRIPLGTSVLPQVSAVLDDERVFDHPADFRPERFLLADGVTPNKEAVDNVSVKLSK